MRFAAQKTLGMQDILPANGTVYMPNMDNKLGSMMQALKDWEKRRGLSMSFRSKFIATKAKLEQKQSEEPKAPKEPTPKVRPITVPRDRKKPWRKPTLSEQERKERKNEWNRNYRKTYNAQACQRSREWRAKQSPEQRAAQLQRVKDWKARQREKRILDNQTGSVRGS